ncbi:MAG: single-stranded DNA-binding protein [Candidatus Cloacimonetes bacterium]|nr:single-stranded DNA-binding protein [Candidatus Cloacimonadota bacterium]
MSKQLRFPRINTIVISGRLTRDVDLRYTASGTPVAKLAIAFDRRYQKDGNWETETSYIDVVVWEDKATSCAENLTKGSAILVEGRLQTRSYTNNEGRNIKITEIQASRVNYLEWNDSNQEKQSSDDKFETSSDPGNTAPAMNTEFMGDSGASTEDDVPF